MWDWFLREPIPSYIIEGNPRAIGGLSRKAPSNARGDDPFLGGFFFSFFLPHLRGRSLKAAPGLGFSPVLSGERPTFLFCGNLLSLDRENDCARPFIFPSWCVPSGSRSDRAGPGLGRGMWGWLIHSYVIGRGNTATAYLQAGKIRPFPATNRSAVVDVQGLRQAASPARGRARAGERNGKPASECGQTKRLRRNIFGRELI